MDKHEWKKRFFYDLSMDEKSRKQRPKKSTRKLILTIQQSRNRRGKMPSENETTTCFVCDRMMIRNEKRLIPLEWLKEKIVKDCLHEKRGFIDECGDRIEKNGLAGEATLTTKIYHHRVQANRENILSSKGKNAQVAPCTVLSRNEHFSYTDEDHFKFLTEQDLKGGRVLSTRTLVYGFEMLNKKLVFHCCEECKEWMRRVIRENRLVENKRLETSHRLHGFGDEDE